MAWDKSQPQDTTKLRNLGTVIRSNWEAIESADATFMPEAINLAKRGANPTAPADTVTIYCKNDSVGKPQLFSINPDAGVYQLTSGASPVLALNGETFLPGPVGIKWGQFTITTNPQTITYIGLGLTDFTTSTYSVQLTGINTAGGSVNIYVSTWDAAGFTVVCTTALANFTFIAIGV